MFYDLRDQHGLRLNYLSEGMCSGGAQTEFAEGEKKFPEEHSRCRNIDRGDRRVPSLLVVPYFPNLVL
jgi:hypothetical protein